MTETNRRAVVGYEEFYEVSADGNVYRISDYRCTWIGRKLKPTPKKNGYLRISLYINGKGRSHLVHRLVALAFIPNPHNLPQINHLNGIRTDNRASNLEWCTSSQNHIHAFRILNRIPTWKGKIGNRIGKKKPELAGKQPKPVRGINMETDEIMEFKSINDAARFINENSGNICLACQGKRTSVCGWQWEYI